MTIRDRLQASLGTTYTLERELTGGGMSHVFLADEKALGRRVVVKMLPKELADSVNVDRFTREIQLAAQLQHPCIVPLLSSGTADGVPYYTMPFVEGRSLRARLTDGGELSIPEALKALRDLASGLAYAHDHGIVHRDIKPDNVLLSDGYALITDFGVAKALSASGADRLTATGVVLGTPSYMSPEQASGDPHVDHRADIYAFGCVAYEMLVGQPPFAGRSAREVTAAHLIETPDAVATRRPSAPPALSRLVARCLEKRAADRPQSARELVQELDAIATPTGGTDAATLTPGTRRHGSRVRWYAVAGAVVAVAALSALGVIVARNRAESAAGAEARRVVVRTLKNNTGDKSLDPIGLMAADWIARGLTETPSVDVAGTESEIAAGDTTGSSASAMTPTALGRLVHARYVISGSYSTQGDSLFLQAEVTDADAARRVLTVAPIGEAIGAKQAALERLRQSVTSSLVPFFDSSIVTQSRAAPRYEAYQEFLLGNQLYQSDPQASIAHLRTAVRLDSTFVFARLRLLSRLHVSNAVAARDSVIAAVEAMRSALSPYDAAAFDIRLGFAHGDLHAAYLAALQARRLAPKSTWAGYELGESALADGRPGEAARVFETLDPESGQLRFESAYYSLLCRAYHALDRLRDMRRCYDRARKQHPSLTAVGYLLRVMGSVGDADGLERTVDSVIAAPQLFVVQAVFELEVHSGADRARRVAERALARTQQATVDSTRATNMLNTRMGLLAFLGRWRELASLADSTLQRGESRWALALGGVAEAMLGDTTGARRRAERLTASPRDRARILAALGDKRSALEALQTLNSPAYLWQYHDDIIYRLMRGYAPFEEFLKPRG
jgi:serine/threonine-protein kinase